MESHIEKLKEIKWTRFGFCLFFPFANLTACSGNKVLIILKLFRRETNMLRASYQEMPQTRSKPYTHRWPGQNTRSLKIRSAQDVPLTKITALHKWRSEPTFYLKLGWHFGKASPGKANQTKKIWPGINTRYMNMKLITASPQTREILVY